MEDLEDHFGDELYIDGNASGNSKRIHGAESWLAQTQTINISTGDARANNAADKVGAPVDTYAGLLTTLGNYGGTWTGSWPQGTGDAHHDFWSPVIVNYTSSAFTGTTFAANAVDAIRYLLLSSQKNKSKKGDMDLVLLEKDLYNDLLNDVDGKERFISRPSRQEGSLAKLGFTNMINLDGTECTWEYGVPVNIGYGFNVDNLRLCSLQSSMFVPEGPDFDIASQSWRFSIDFYGNLESNPRTQGKLLNIA